MSSPTQQGERQPILFVALGRQRTGKTTFLNGLVQSLDEGGADFAVWNADTQNRTYNLSAFRKDVLVPPSTEASEVKAWIEARLTRMVEERRDVIADIGGGVTPFSRLVEEVPIVRMLKRRGIRLVVAHVVGPEKADLDYMEGYAADELLTPEATLIVLNQGLVASERSVDYAFSEVMASKALMREIDRGARPAFMPRLSCMHLVTDRGLTFREAAEGVSKAGHEPMSFIDQERVAIWWERAFPRFIADIPSLWLPALRAERDRNQQPKAKPAKPIAAE